MFNIREIKKSAVKKLSQGDVNVYLLKSMPEIGELKSVKNPILVKGNTGNNHKLVGGKFSIQTNGSQFIIKVSRSTELTHEQHKPSFTLKPGIYLVDRAREKGMFNDMVNPVAD